jgi:hypothetical protein
VDNWKNITNSQNSVRKKSFGVKLSNCHIIGLDNGSLVLIVFGCNERLFTLWTSIGFCWAGTRPEI